MMANECPNMPSNDHRRIGSEPWDGSALGGMAQRKTAPSRFKNSQIIFSANRERRRGSESQEGRNRATLNRSDATDDQAAHSKTRRHANQIGTRQIPGTRTARHARAASRWRASSMRRSNSEAQFGHSAIGGAETQHPQRWRNCNDPLKSNASRKRKAPRLAQEQRQRGASVIRRVPSRARVASLPPSEPPAPAPPLPWRGARPSRRAAPPGRAAHRARQRVW